MANEHAHSGSENNLSQPALLEQRRARAAWKHVSDLRNAAYAKKYGQLARGAAADIQLNGLGQTLAFWIAKKERHHLALFEHVSAWVKLELRISGQGNLLEWIIERAAIDEYRRATAEAVAFLVWIKRFSEAELIKPGLEDD